LRRLGRHGRKRRDVLDRVAIVALALGVGAVATRLLPAADAAQTVRRIVPLLLFLGAVIVLAELTAKAEVFDVIAARAAIAASGSLPVLFLLSAAFAAATAMFLNLDTTAVLLTPVMLALAEKVDVPGAPLAMTTVWLANTASLLLPVSNLTNLLAADRVDLSAPRFAGRMLAPQLAAIAATAGCLWVLHWGRGRRGEGRHRYVPPPPHTPSDRVLFAVAAVACAVFVVLVLAGVPLALSSLACAGAVVVAFRLRAPHELRWRLLPWRLLVFVTGLFIVVQTVSRYGLGALVRGVIGQDGGPLGVVRAAGTGAALSNALNNLPAYVTGEAAVPLSHGQQLIGLLIGTNVGPIVTPWASLATLLWYERCRAGNAQVPWLRFMLTGAITAACVLVAAVCGLLVTWPG
jgi:arsenical pump membrane protein